MDVKQEAAKLMGGGFGGPVTVKDGEDAEKEIAKKPEVADADGESA